MSKVFKIATWNINSIRIRMEQLKKWLQTSNIDILFLQEIKCLNEQFPLEELEELGYNCYVHGQKSYNGVAILSKYPADEIITNFENNPCSSESRFIEINLQLPLGYSKIMCVYVPNGGEALSEKYELKLKFLDALKDYLNSRDFEDRVIIGGDFNVAPEEVDVYSVEDLRQQTCFTDQERAKIRSMINSGLLDPLRLIDTSEGIYSWWDYRAGCLQKDLGLRIDYFLTSANCTKFLKNCYVDKPQRMIEKTSDHAPVVTEFII